MRTNNNNIHYAQVAQVLYCTVQETLDVLYEYKMDLVFKCPLCIVLFKWQQQSLTNKLIAIGCNSLSVAAAVFGRLTTFTKLNIFIDVYMNIQTNS